MKTKVLTALLLNVASVASAACSAPAELDWPKVVAIDPAFSTHEVELIGEALQRWQSAGPGLIEFDAYIGTTAPDGLNAAVIHKNREAEAGARPGEMGAAFWPGGDMYVFAHRIDATDRKARDVLFVTTAMHELGHFVGLPDTSSGGALMQSPANTLLPCVTQQDLDALCAIYGCSFRAPECNPNIESDTHRVPAPYPTTAYASYARARVATVERVDNARDAGRVALPTSTPFEIAIVGANASEASSTQIRGGSHPLGPSGTRQALGSDAPRAPGCVDVSCRSSSAKNRTG